MVRCFVQRSLVEPVSFRLASLRCASLMASSSVVPAAQAQLQWHASQQAPRDGMEIAHSRRQRPDRVVGGGAKDKCTQLVLVSDNDIQPSIGLALPIVEGAILGSMPGQRLHSFVGVSPLPTQIGLPFSRLK